MQEAPDGRFLLSVRDDGDGIPVHVEDGYGLQAKRDRARLLGGILRVSSEPGGGTSLILSAPIVAP